MMTCGGSTGGKGQSKWQRLSMGNTLRMFWNWKKLSAKRIQKAGRICE